MVVFGLWTGHPPLARRTRARWTDKMVISRTAFHAPRCLASSCAQLDAVLTPILANALILAASSDTVAQGMVSLAVFALGLSLPMLVLMVLYQGVKDVFRWLRDHQPLLRRIGGLLMIAYGLYLLISALI
jgi:cytochrome c biogenesis protein CcdA